MGGGESPRVAGYVSGKRKEDYGYKLNHKLKFTLLSFALLSAQGERQFQMRICAQGLDANLRSRAIS